VSEQDGILLELRHWSLVRETADGPLPLLRELDLKLHRGELLGLLGGNGSGKTSLLRWLAGEDSPLRSVAALVFQDPDEQLVTARVAEELTLGRPHLAPQPLLEEFGLAGLADRDPRLLSAGEKQRLVLAVALAGEPQVLLCDEPTSLQDRAQSAWLLDRLQAWRRATGGTLVLATQRRAEAELCDRLLVLQDGRAAACGEPSRILDLPAARELLAPLAPAPGARAARPPAAPDPGAVPVAEWRDVGRSFATGGGIRDVNLVLQAGARLGITGRNGCGKSLLLAMAAGLLAPTAGRCHLDGRPLCSRDVPDLDHRVALLAPQFPEYFFTRTAVGAEIALDPALKGRAAEVLAAAGLPASWTGRNPHDLSSGERRRLAVALTVLAGRRLLLLDEPTAGLDLAGRRRLLALLRCIPQAAALVVASHDAEFLTACGCSTYELGPNGLIRRATSGGEGPLAPAEPLD